MAYYTKILAPGEEVRYAGRLHWAIYVRAWLALLVAVAAALDYFYLRPSSEQMADNMGSAIPGVIAAFFLIGGILLFLSAWVRRVTTEIVVTDRRIIFKEGLIQRRTMEMNMSKVETVDVVQSIWGRLFNYGNILIRGTGSTYEPLRLVASPVALRTAIIAR